MSNRKFPGTCFAQNVRLPTTLLCAWCGITFPPTLAGEDIGSSMWRCETSAPWAAQLPHEQRKKDGIAAIAISYTAPPAIWSVKDRNLCVSAMVESTKLVRAGGLTVTLLRWALLFFLISIVAGVLGFTGISAASADIARILFYIFAVIFLVLLILGLTVFRV